MNYVLPMTLNVGGIEYEIRSDYRAVLDICAALNDPELDDIEKRALAVAILYPNWDKIPAKDSNAALTACFDFIACGEKNTGNKNPKLMDWEQDFRFIAPAINRVLGQEIRAVTYLHWWTFVSAYYEIGDCLFARIVGIRDKKAHGKRLDKSEQEWYRKNREIIDFKRNYTAADKAALGALGLK